MDTSIDWYFQRGHRSCPHASKTRMGHIVTNSQEVCFVSFGCVSRPASVTLTCFNQVQAWDAGCHISWAFHLCVWTSQCVGFPVHRGHDRFLQVENIQLTRTRGQTDVMPLLQNPWRRVDRDIEGNLTCVCLIACVTTFCGFGPSERQCGPNHGTEQPLGRIRMTLTWVDMFRWHSA